MATTILMISDTHVPQRARALPEQVWAAIESVDVVLHAGDWVSAQIVDEITARARRVVGVAGNNDGPDLHDRLPEVGRVTLEGVRFAVVHETGDKAGREARCDTLYADDTDVLVFGHSHIPWDTTTPRGLRLLNPGSPTDRRQQPVGTYLTATVDGGELFDLRLVPVVRDQND